MSIHKLVVCMCMCSRNAADDFFFISEILSAAHQFHLVEKWLIFSQTPVCLMLFLKSGVLSDYQGVWLSFTQEVGTLL